MTENVQDSGEQLLLETGKELQLLPQNKAALVPQRAAPHQDSVMIFLIFFLNPPLLNHFSADPSCREPRSSYILRYQGIADKHIVSALQSADDVAKELGGTAWHEILSQNKGLALLLADCQLARDTLQASMRYASI
jgi:hypothetical protein